MLLSQIRTPAGELRVIAREGTEAYVVRGAESVRSVALDCARSGESIAARVGRLGFELDVIAAVFIGGASMAGGVGTIVGAVIGAFIMGVMNNGMSILGIGIDYQQVIKGLVLLAAVIFDVYNKNKV